MEAQRYVKPETAHIESMDLDLKAGLNLAQEAEQADHEESTWHAIRSNPKIILFCLFGNIGALMYGFDNLALSIALEMMPFQYVKRLLLDLWTDKMIGPYTAHRLRTDLSSLLTGRVSGMRWVKSVP